MNDPESENRWTHAYRTMTARIKRILDGAEGAAPTLHEAVEQARHRAVEFGELTREESERVAAHVRRDLQHAGHHLAEARDDLAAWFYMDRRLIEQELLDWFTRAADQTRLELQRFTTPPPEPPTYETGELTGPGRLTCLSCGETLERADAGVIPACPNCGGTQFRRGPPADVSSSEET
jgi:rubrerythrin